LVRRAARRPSTKRLRNLGVPSAFVDRRCAQGQSCPLQLLGPHAAFRLLRSANHRRAASVSAVTRLRIRGLAWPPEESMKKQLSTLLLLLAVGVAGSTALSAQGTVARSGDVSKSATITAINQTTRVVTL